MTDKCKGVVKDAVPINVYLKVVNGTYHVWAEEVDVGTLWTCQTSSRAIAEYVYNFED